MSIVMPTIAAWAVGPTHTSTLTTQHRRPKLYLSDWHGLPTY
jgi:hypothetical protein